MPLLVLLAFLISFSVSLSARADLQHERIRRVVVFPLKVDKDYATTGEEAWWELRERLTESKRFLVASKNFMQAKDVYQARGELQPADAIILGRLLDANALVTTFLVDRRLSMRVYETKNGLTLWSADADLHPAVPVTKQLVDSAKRLLYDFVAAIPYQGFVVVDNLIGRPAYSEGEKLLVKADVGSGTQITVGDTAQLIRIRADRLRPMFQEGLTMEAYAEGQVAKVDRNIITILISRKQEGQDIKADALVLIPDELRRLKEIYGIHEDPEKNIGVDLFKGEGDELTEKQKRQKPLVTSLSWIGNLALVLLLAF